MHQKRFAAAGVEPLEARLMLSANVELYAPIFAEVTYADYIMSIEQLIGNADPTQQVGSESGKLNFLIDISGDADRLGRLRVEKLNFYRSTSALSDYGTILWSDRGTESHGSHIVVSALSDDTFLEVLAQRGSNWTTSMKTVPDAVTRAFSSSRIFLDYDESTGDFDSDRLSQYGVLNHVPVFFAATSELEGSSQVYTTIDITFTQQPVESVQRDLSNNAVSLDSGVLRDDASPSSLPNLSGAEGRPMIFELACQETHARLEAMKNEADDSQESEVTSAVKLQTEPAAASYEASTLTDATEHTAADRRGEAVTFATLSPEWSDKANRVGSYLSQAWAGDLARIDFEANVRSDDKPNDPVEPAPITSRHVALAALPLLGVTLPYVFSSARKEIIRQRSSPQLLAFRGPRQACGSREPSVVLAMQRAATWFRSRSARVTHLTIRRLLLKSIGILNRA